METPLLSAAGVSKSKMPLLNKKPFIPDSIPSDLRPDEEVFVCQATKEVFRDYE